MAIEIVPEWMVSLDDEDISFIKKFLQASGSLKEMARQYSVTYPTVNKHKTHKYSVGRAYSC